MNFKLNLNFEPYHRGRAREITLFACLMPRGRFVGCFFLHRVTLPSRIVRHSRYGGFCSPSHLCKAACAMHSHSTRQGTGSHKASASGHCVPLAKPSTSKAAFEFVMGPLRLGRSYELVGRGLLAVPCRILLQHHRRECMGGRTLWLQCGKAERARAEPDPLNTLVII